MTASPSTVRAARPEDEGELWSLFRLMHSEAGLFPLCEPKVQDYLRRVLHPETIPPNDTGPRGIIGVIGPPDRLEAAIMLVLGAIWYTNQISLQDCINFVHPKYRQSDHAKALIAYSRHMTDEIRKTDPDFQMMVGVVSTKRTAAKVRLYRRQLAEIGSFFVYPTPAGYEPAEVR